MKRITLEDWITEALSDADKGAPCSVLSLIYLKGIGTEEVHSKVIEATANMRGLAEFFTNKACAYAQDLPGVQSFRLEARYGKAEAQASHTFTVFEGQVTAGNLTPWSKHEPTGNGLLAQLMKHNEQIMGQYSTLVQGFVGMLMSDHVEHNKEKAEMHVILRDVLLNMKKEEHANRIEQLKFQRESEERAMFGRALPGMMNYVTGREIVPESHVDSQLVEAMALKFSPQDLQMLVALGKISQQEALVLSQRFSKIREEAEKRQKALAAAPSEETPDAQAKPA
jgi:hypothetical protein